MPYDATDIEALGFTAGLRLLLEDADRIEKLPPERFDMGKDGSRADAQRGECKSPACIGGWVRAWNGIDTDDIVDAGNFRWGIDEHNVDGLMFPGTRRMLDGREAYSATPAQAAQAMRNLAYSEAANPGHGDPMWETVG